MNYIYLYIIYGSAVFFTVTAVFLGIINWIQSSSLSASLEEVQKDIEKKGREFDSIKLSLQSATHTQNEYTSPESTPSSAPDFPAEIGNQYYDNSDSASPGEDPETPQIDVVRNLRGDFDTPENGVMKRETVIMKRPTEFDAPSEPVQTAQNEPVILAQDSKVHAFPDVLPPAQNNTDFTEDVTIDVSSIETPTHHENFSKQTKDAMPTLDISTGKIPRSEYQEVSIPEVEPEYTTPQNYTPDSNSTIPSELDIGIPPLEFIGEDTGDDVMDIIGDESTKQPSSTQMEKPSVFTLPLFSKALNDADFKGMEKEVEQLLSTEDLPLTILVDCSEILFLYQAETDLLRSIAQQVLKTGSSFGFINCSTELVKRLWEVPDLSPLIMD